MAFRRIGLSALFVLGLAPHVWAQQAAQPPVETTANSAGLDVNRLPLNLNRINQSLRRSVEREERNGLLNLRYSIEVYGTAPRIQFFDPRRDNLTTGDVPRSAPTHQDMLQFWTPKEFSSPVMDLNGLGRWFTDKARGK